MSPSQPSFCTPGKPARNLSVTSLPSPSLRNTRPLMSSDLGAQQLLARRIVAVEPFQLETRDFDIVNLAAGCDPDA